jgi:hypothetical protein
VKIKLNSEALRMVVLKQIVANASLGIKTEREMSFISRIFPFTPSNSKLSRLHDRGDKLQMFDLALSKNKDEFIEIDYHDVNFIYQGFKDY